MILKDALEFIVNSNEFATVAGNYEEGGAFCKGIDIRLFVEGGTKTIYCEANFDYGDAGQSPDDIKAKVKYDNGDFKEIYIE